MTTPKIGERITLKQPYPISSAYFREGITPEHTLIFAGERKTGDWKGMWAVAVIGRFHFDKNPFSHIDNPIYHIEPSAFTVQSETDGTVPKTD